MIITSLLDTDLYKLTMQHFAFNNYPNTIVEYTFKNRTEDVDLRPFKAEIIDEVMQLERLQFAEEEVAYLKNLGFFNDAFLDFLKHFQLNPSRHVEIYDGSNNLEIKITGTWLDTILFEVPVLAIVNEVYFRNESTLNPEEATAVLKNSLKNIEKSPELKFAEFGTRRRYSKVWQKKVLENIQVSQFCQSNNLVGTSNVHYAKEFNIKPIGTMAHEFIEFFQGIVALKESQKTALDLWIKQYRGSLGIALSDTLGTDAFLRDFDLYFAKLYDGLRQDSGDPFEWGEKVIKHYKNLGIDPKSKTLVFSDGLTLNKAAELDLYFKDKADVSFGIGTHLTNNIPGYKALNIVMKMTKSNGQPVAKISDSPGKGMCKNETYLAWLKEVFEIEA